MINFRIADEADTYAVSELLAALYEEVGHTPTAAEIADSFLQIDSNDLHSTLLALDDDEEPVGILTIVESIALYAGGRIGVINELYVVPKYRSEGVGKILLDAAKELAEARGWVRLEVTTPGEDYEKTLRFYEREGFMAIGPRYKYMLD
ncbi:MAG: GNAT family N-acetyltransferase [Saprospiraceae bacterium]|nr:GNAT family N-acetyltransferase [Saprospiraceae bacterium]